MTFQATALKLGIQGDIAFLQNVTIKDKLANGVGALVNGNDAKTFDFSTPGATALDSIPANSPYFKNTGEKLQTDSNGFETVTDYDAPQITAGQILPRFIPNTATATNVDVEEDFSLYAVWKYSDGTYYVLGQVTWNWRVAGTISNANTETSTYVWTPNGNNGITQSGAFVRGQGPPAAIAPPLAGNFGATWR
jgi:hypothetical protein